MVRLAGLEPARVAPLPPQSSVSANSTISALPVNKPVLAQLRKVNWQKPRGRKSFSFSFDRPQNVSFDLGSVGGSEPGAFNKARPQSSAGLAVQRAGQVARAARGSAFPKRCRPALATAVPIHARQAVIKANSNASALPMDRASGLLRWGETPGEPSRIVIGSRGRSPHQPLAK